MEVLLGVLWYKAAGQAKDIVQHLNLAVALNACSDTNGGNGQPLSNDPGQGSRHTLQHNGEGSSRLQLYSTEKWQELWLQRQVYPKIGASFRCIQRKNQKDVGSDEDRFYLTCASVDYGQYLVCYANEDELQIFVADTTTFIENRRNTVFVVIDETAIWLKCQGEEKVLLATFEVFDERNRRVLRKQLRRCETSAQQEAAKALFI